VKTTLGIYSHAVDSNRLAAQEQFLNTLLAARCNSGTKSGLGKDREGANCNKRNGRHEETRTPDLYRVKVVAGYQPAINSTAVNSLINR